MAFLCLGAKIIHGFILKIVLNLGVNPGANVHVLRGEIFKFEE